MFSHINSEHYYFIDTKLEFHTNCCSAATMYTDRYKLCPKPVSDWLGFQIEKPYYKKYALLENYLAHAK